MGEVVEVGSENKALKVGDRVVVPFTISCGECFFCKRGYFSACERSNPDKPKATKLWGNSPAGLFGYSHLLGGYAGGQAEYLRVPYADVGAPKGPAGLTGFEAMMEGKGDVVTGWMNKLQTAIASITPAGVLAEQHRRMAEPGSAAR
jgi:threonine dehydrogenase-like Zn-dependent dehydrogenase